MYSYAFVTQQKNIFLFSSPITTTASFFVIRLAILTICAWYLLHSTMRDSILLLTSFIMTFWVFLLLKKARLHDGS